MTLLVWGRPDGGVTQFAYFVADIEAAAPDFTARLGVGPWFVRGPFQPHARLRGEPNQPVVSLARGSPATLVRARPAARRRAVRFP
jgi:hypothetical protein